MMQKVKPLVPPKPNGSSSAVRVNSSHTVGITSDAIATDAIEDGTVNPEENISILVQTVTPSAENNCLQFPTYEAECSPKQGPRVIPPLTAPKPKPRCKNNELSGSNSSLSNAPDQCGSATSGDVVCDPDLGDITSKKEMATKCKSSKNFNSETSSCVGNVDSKQDLLSNQENLFPVKPPRPKKVKKLSLVPKADLDVSINAQQEILSEIPSKDVEHKHSVEEDEKEKDLDECMKSKKKSKPKLFVRTVQADGVADAEGVSAGSTDSGRLFRSPSYEKALEENVLKCEKTGNSGEDDISGGSCMNNFLDVDLKSLPWKSASSESVPTAVNSSSPNNLYYNIQPTRLAPLPPSKPKVPLLNRKQKIASDNGASSPHVAESICAVHKDAAGFINPIFHAEVKKSKDSQLKRKPNYENVHSRHVHSLNEVKRSSSESVTKSSSTGKSGHFKGKLPRKCSASELMNEDKEKRQKSVFYCNLNTLDNGSCEVMNTLHNLAPDDPNAYLDPFCDSHCTCGIMGLDNLKSSKHYENMQPVEKSVQQQSQRKTSDLDTIIPVSEMEEASNVYSEIDELDTQVPVQMAPGCALIDEEGYTVINEENKAKKDSYDSDTDYIYPENWTHSLASASVSDTYVYAGDGNGFASNLLPKAAERRLKACDLQDLNEDVRSPQPLQSYGSDIQNQESFCLSRSLSPVSSVLMSEEGCSPCELTEEEIKMNAEKKKKKAFLTAQEILTSEKTFVDVLRLLSQDFVEAVKHASEVLGKQVVAPSVLNQITKYLPELLKFNEELLEDLTSRIKNWDAVPRVADIFVKKGAFLKLYTNYIREFNSMVALLDETRRKNLDFDRVVTEFEVGRCEKLALKHYMLKPIQRIPQYRLLLGDYQKQLSEDSPDFKDANTAILIVSEVAEHANESMKYGDNLNRLLEIQNSLIGQFEVIVPGRTLLKDGILMKLSRKEMQPRMFYLFSDVLLYTTPVSSGYKVNNILPLNTVKVSNPAKEDFQNEFSIISTQRSFTVSARTNQEKTEWLMALEDAISSIRMKRHSYNQGKLTLPSIVSIEIDAMDFKLGTKAPVWIPDDRVSMCMICKEEFSLLFRRHHCRGCGKVVCASCSSYEAPLRYLQYKPERVCSECFVALNKVIDDMDDELSVDTAVTSPQVDQTGGTNKFLKRSIKSQFRSFALDSGTPKSAPVKRPAVLQEVNANDRSAEMSGYLHQWKERKWKKTWFVLKEKVLYAFKASEDAAAEKSTPLLGYEITPFNTYFQGIEPNLIFELCHRGMPSIIFKTESLQSRDRWMSAMRSATMP